jgi:hypothetical protein
VVPALPGIHLCSTVWKILHLVGSTEFTAQVTRVDVSKESVAKAIAVARTRSTIRRQGNAVRSWESAILVKITPIAKVDTALKIMLLHLAKSSPKSALVIRSFEDVYGVPPKCYSFGDKGLGDFCSANTDCLTGICADGVCSCSPSTNQGCPDGWFCAIYGGTECYSFIARYDLDPAMKEVLQSDAAEMYDHCTNDAFASLQRSWLDRSSPDVDTVDEIALCSNQGVSKEGGVYQFTLNNSQTVTVTCPDDMSPEAVCAVTGAGLLSEIGGPCYDGADCVTANCWYDNYVEHGGGTCTCNPTTNNGCTGDYECADPDLIFDDQGYEFAPPPTCYLPYGADCSSSPNDCLTDNCDGLTCGSSLNRRL